MPTRADAWDLLCEWTKTDALRRHGLAVEAAVAWYGEHRFGIAGDELEIWRSAGPPPRLRLRTLSGDPPDSAARTSCAGSAIAMTSSRRSSATATTPASPRTSLLARTVYACDEMTGFVIAVTYVRPNRSLDEVDVRSVTKKMKDKGFARQVPRDQLEKGAIELGVPFDEHVLNVIEGLEDDPRRARPLGPLSRQSRGHGREPEWRMRLELVPVGRARHVVGAPVRVAVLDRHPDRFAEVDRILDVEAVQRGLARPSSDRPAA